MESYERNTGCGAECKQGRQITNDRTVKFCGSTPRSDCATVVAPCDPGTGQSGAAEGPAGPLPDMSKKDNDSNNMAIAGGAAAGLIALTAIALVACCCVRRRRVAQRKSAAALQNGDDYRGSHRDHLHHDQRAGNGQYHGTGQHPASGKGPPMLHNGQFGSGGAPPWGGPAPGPSVHPALHHGNSSHSKGAAKASLERHGCGNAPASRVKVTSRPGRNTFDVTTASSWGPTLTGASAASSISATSSPQQVLDAQLDFIEAAQRGMLNRTIRRAPFKCHMGRSAACVQSLLHCADNGIHKVL